MHNEFTAVIEAADEGGVVAYCPGVPGANGQGETPEKAKQNLAEAIELLRDCGLVNMRAGTTSPGASGGRREV